MLAIRQIPTTPCHDMANGLAETLDGALKALWRRMCSEQPKAWCLPALLFPYREAPRLSMGLSPFELLYRRPVRGPLSILRDKEQKDEVRTTYQYVLYLS